MDPSEKTKPPSFSLHFLKWFGLLLAIAVAANAYFQPLVRRPQPVQADASAIASKAPAGKGGPALKMAVNSTASMAPDRNAPSASEAQVGAAVDSPTASLSRFEKASQSSELVHKPGSDQDPNMGLGSTSATGQKAQVVIPPTRNEESRSLPTVAQNLPQGQVAAADRCNLSFPVMNTASGNEDWFRLDGTRATLTVTGSNVDAIAQIRERGELRLQVAIPKGTSVRFSIPSGLYQLRVVSGTSWCGFVRGFEIPRPIFDEDLRATDTRSLNVVIPSI